MFVIVLLCLLLTRISIAILAQMWAGVVLANILAHHAAAELTLSFVAVIAVLDDGRFWIEEVAFGNLHTEEVHQGLVVRGKTDHKVGINASVVLHAIEIGSLTASGQSVVPAFRFVQLH